MTHDPEIVEAIQKVINGTDTSPLKWWVSCRFLSHNTARAVLDELEKRGRLK